MQVYPNMCQGNDQGLTQRQGIPVSLKGIPIVICGSDSVLTQLQEHQLSVERDTNCYMRKVIQV